MKTIKAAVIVVLLLAVGGCAWLAVEPAQNIIAHFEYVPRTHNPGVDHWLPRILLSMEVDPTPMQLDGHVWSVDWGDNSSTTWSDGRFNWLKDDQTKYGNTRVALIHKYYEPGTYNVEVTYDGKLSVRGSINVPLMASGEQSYYDEDGSIVQVEYEPWTPGCADGS